MYDLSTGFLGPCPSYTKTGGETWENVKRFQWPAQISYIYSDGSAEIDAACKQAGIVHDCSQAGDPQNNALAERQVQESVQGRTCNLLQAGLPHQFWPWAMRYHAVAANFTKDKRGTSPWQRKFDEDFEAKIIPFGARILFIPNKTTKLWKINSSFKKSSTRHLPWLEACVWKYLAAHVLCVCHRGLRTRYAPQKQSGSSLQRDTPRRK